MASLLADLYHGGRWTFKDYLLRRTAIKEKSRFLSGRDPRGSGIPHGKWI
jgi:hypothetical protein